ncbi:MAG: DNA polymerase III subunit gamma/tau [Candidatus Omnitrophica bacterium]|nr:DNA polymerase III subunit gamma/tau [Candidatus Omnitrophota bacterium]
MVYQAFSLKWRPQSFDEVVGQENTVATLKNALAKGRISHAYLFSGPRGVGKTSVARIFAKALNCKDGPTPNPCQKCASCLEITRGVSLDVIEIDAASNRGIDEIRALRDNVKFAPVAGKFKIYIIDEVHMLTTEAFNALLKTLEEPPEFVKFIFATTHPHKVIPTILSRCLRFDFGRIPALKIIAQLEKIAAAENINIEKEVFLAVARASDGSLRDAESILDQLVSFKADRICGADVHSMLGVVETESFFEVTRKIIHKDAQAAVVMLDEIINQGKDAGLFLSGLIEHFRNIMIAKVTKEKTGLIDLPSEYYERLLEQSRAFSLEEIFSVFNLLVNTQEVAKRFGSARIPLEIAIVKLSHDKRKSEIAAPDTLMPKPKERNSAAAGPAKADSSQPQNQSYLAQELEKLRSFWPAVIENVGYNKMSVATYLSQAQLLKLDKDTLVIGFARNNSLHKEIVEKKENRLLIEKAIKEIAQLELRLECVLLDEAKEESPPERESVQQLLNVFGGRLIKES